ncbi:MAG: transcriptional repressor NrdR [Chloroflexi bacterium]|nr:transcriptional repressor NrdR [Chloroflexota bacterium]
MHCPYCAYDNTKVIDSRETDMGVRRRRECPGCGQRFTTRERAESASIQVVKKDGRREEFDARKVADGIRKACTKRPVSVEMIEQFVSGIEADLFKLGRAEVSSQTVGEMVMDRLRELDEVAYVRFASVYRQFTDVESLVEEIEGYREWKRKSAQLKHQLTLLELD